MQLKARNMQDLFPQMAKAFVTEGVETTSRNGKTMRLPGVTSIEITHPNECVCFVEGRDANPFFHLVEAIAMLGRFNSNYLLSALATNMASFTDDGVTYNAFYGERARTTWGDQLGLVINELATDPDSRQCVVNLCDPADLLRDTKDKACNLCMIFSVVDGKLCMTTMNRSNDAVWGFCTGANMVHFPMFQLFVANALELPVGSWHHVSNNMHIYDWNEKWDTMVNKMHLKASDPYGGATGVYPVKSLMFPEEGSYWDQDAHIVLCCMVAAIAELRSIGRSGLNADAPCVETNITNVYFFRTTLIPMFNAFLAYKQYRLFRNPRVLEVMHVWVDTVYSPDWQLAAHNWLNPRIAKLQKGQDPHQIQP